MSERRFTKEHLWVDFENEVATVGITDHTHSTAGEIIHAESVELKTVAQSDAIGSVEFAQGGTADILAPVGGEVIEVNPIIDDEPGQLNTGPGAWLCRIKVSNENELKSLLSADAYAQFCKEGS
ncbi:glycine cleavage system protein H [Streptomyces sp. NPDC002209]|uniref:glycine cleavage system protein H n=1 Tax=Streptomyces sp. NPDC002209 TaxID=3364638 RepID=UPI0036C597AE